ARQLFASMQDGDYDFTDYIDEDSPGGIPCRLKLSVKVRGDEAIFDFTGSDPQLQSALNMPTGGLPRHILPLVGYNYVVYSLDRTVALNMGLLRPVRDDDRQFAHQRCRQRAGADLLPAGKGADRPAGHTGHSQSQSHQLDHQVKTVQLHGRRRLQF
ncbi:MAG: hypothetical protein EOP86_28400, partial [Verrucomicrobiaceae bacterium]